MSSYTIRLFAPADLPRLREITIATFGPVSVDRLLEERHGPFGEQTWQERKVAAIDNDCRLQADGVFVAADTSDCAVGFVTTRLFTSSGIGWIPNLAVDPAWQGQGVGRALLERAIGFLRERGMSIAKIETLGHNEVGNHLYPSVGFEELVRQVHFSMRLDAAPTEARE